MSAAVFSPSWVYSFADYCQMFALSEEAKSKLILDYPGSISSFNAEARRRGQSVVSADAIYSQDLSIMRQTAERTLNSNKEALRYQRDDLLRSTVELDSLFQQWQDTASLFLSDYEQGCNDQRYISVNQPQWPFSAHQFDIALCSDIDFTQHQELDISPLQVIQELVRVSKEVRIFPLFNAQSAIAEEWGPVMHWLQEHHFGQEIELIQFHELKGSNAMLRIWATECPLER